MALQKKKAFIKLNKYFPAFEKIDFDALLADLDERIENAEAGVLAPGSVSLTELDAAVQVSLGKADSAIQAPVASGDTDAAVQVSLGKADSAIQPTLGNDIVDLAAAPAAGTDAVLIDAANAKIDALLAVLRSAGILNA